MLTISVRLDRDTVLEYCRKCRTPYSAGCYVYLAEDGGKQVAAGLFEVGGDRVQVLLYEAENPADAFLLDGVLRAGLNYAAENGVENGLLPEELRHRYRELFTKLNYPAQSVFNITNFFQKYKNCRLL